MKQRKHPRTISITDADYNFFRRLGGGNASEGMSRAVEQIKRAQDQQERKFKDEVTK